MEAPLRPSRFVAKDKIAEYSKNFATKFAMNGRVRDPFGQVQDPTAAPPPPPTPKNPTPRGPAPKTVFGDVIKKLHINTIMPSENRFIIGTQSYKKGDACNITFKGRPIKTKVTGVSAEKIDFENTETGEIASLKMELLPPGVKSGVSGLSIPGMVPNQGNTPIIIDP